MYESSNFINKLYHDFWLINKWTTSKSDFVFNRVVLEQKKLSDQWLENQMLNFAAKLFGNATSIKYIVLNKLKNKNLYEFIFISNNMSIDEEEKFIDMEIDFEEKYPEFYFDFIILRRTNTNIKKIIEELKEQGKENILIL